MRTRAIASFIGLVVMLSPAAAASAAGAGDGAGDGLWPQWRGPARDGACEGPTWPDAIGPERVTTVWRVDDLGPSYSGPIVAADRVFTTETRGEEVEVVRAVDRATGRELWKSEWKGAMKVPFFAAKNGSWIRSTPAYDGERLYVAGMRDVLVALDAATGATVWTCDFSERFGTAVPSFGFVCSPLVVDGHVYVQAGASLVKLDARTGETVWRTLEGAGGMDSAFSSPVLTTLHGTPQLVVQTRAEICGVAPDDGTVLWRRPIKSFRGMNILTPMVHDDRVFTATYGGRAQMLTVDRADDAYVVEQAWNQKTQGYMTSPVIVDGHAYLFTRSNRFTCLDLATGEVKWTSGPTGDSYWSLVRQGDRILALNETGRLRLIHATPDAYEVLGEAEVADDQTWAHLTVVGGEIYVRAQTGLIALRWE